MPILIPGGVKVEIKSDGVTVSGPKGTLKRQFNPSISITQEGNNLIVSPASDSREHRALHGLSRTLLANMVDGVAKGFEKDLEIVGVGYRAEMAGNKLTLRVGFSHQVEVVALPGISLALDGPSRIRVTGADKELVGEMAAEIRAVRRPDPYKGKGIRYAGETVRLKAGKAGKAIGKKQ